MKKLEFRHYKTQKFFNLKFSEYNNNLKKLSLKKKNFFFFFYSTDVFLKKKKKVLKKTCFLRKFFFLENIIFFFSKDFFMYSCWFYKNLIYKLNFFLISANQLHWIWNFYKKIYLNNFLWSKKFSYFFINNNKIMNTLNNIQFFSIQKHQIYKTLKNNNKSIYKQIDTTFLKKNGQHCLLKNFRNYLYLFFSKFFYKSLNKKSLLKKYKINFFELQSNDFITLTFLRLTRSSKTSNFYEFANKLIKFKIIKTLSTKKIFFVQNLFNSNNFFFNSSLNTKNKTKTLDNNLWSQFFFKEISFLKKKNFAFSNSLIIKKYKSNKKLINLPLNLLKKKNILNILFNKNSSIEFLFYIFNNKLLWKFNVFKYLKTNFKLDNFWFYFIYDFLKKFELNNKLIINSITNLIPTHNFLIKIKKIVIKTFNYQKFSVMTAPFYVTTLVRFLENIMGKKILIKVFNFLNYILTAAEKMQCLLWSQKLRSFRKALGPRLFLAESLEIIYISLKLKDPYFLSNWMINLFQKISFWKFKFFFRYLKYIFRYFFITVFEILHVKGIKFQLKGKISVAGNARTRTIRQRVGLTSHATFNNKVVYNLNLVRTFTGVQGLKVWIFF